MNRNRRKILYSIIYAIPLLVIVILLFNVYTAQNRERILEQNKNYAEDVMRRTAQQISDQFERKALFSIRSGLRIRMASPICLTAGRLTLPTGSILRAACGERTESRLYLTGALRKKERGSCFMRRWR